MNDQPENTSPQPDPKRETKELTPPLPALLKDQPNEPPPIPQGDDAMPTEWTIETLVAEVQRRGEISDTRMETVTAWLRRHDAEIGEINTWRAGVLTPEQLSNLFDEKTRAHWEGIDAEYTRIGTLLDDISGKYGNAAFAMEKVNAMEGKLTQVLEAQQVRDQRQKESTDAMNQMVETFRSGYVALFGVDPMKPNLPRLKPSVMEEIEKIESDTKTAVKRAETAEKEVDDLRVILAGFTGQFQGEKGLFAEMREMRNYFETKRQREQLQAGAWKAAINIFQTRIFQAVVGSIVGTTAAGLFIKFVEVLSTIGG